MNREDDLDCLIDEAARQLAQHEPSDALTRAVMARIARESWFVSRGFLWTTAASGIAAASLVVFLGSHRTEQTQGSELKGQGSGQASQLTAPGSRLMAQPALREPLESKGAQGTTTESALMQAEEMEAIADPIIIEAIAPAPIEMDPLEVAAATPIEPVDIAPIVIEPLSASND